jgi:metal-responsive CopG/Arc/MetJ family transcriptional regulator
MRQMEIMAKKVAISITIDGDVLRELDTYLRKMQSADLSSSRSLSTRSSVVEKIVAEKLKNS